MREREGGRGYRERGKRCREGMGKGNVKIRIGTEEVLLLRVRRGGDGEGALGRGEGRYGEGVGKKAATGRRGREWELV